MEEERLTILKLNKDIKKEWDRSTFKALKSDLGMRPVYHQSAKQT